MGNVPGSVDFAPERHGRKIGTIGLDQEPPGGDGPGRGLDGAGAPEGHNPGKGDMVPQLQHRRRHLRPAGEAMQHTGQTPVPGENLQQIGIRIPVMDDNGQGEIPGQGHGTCGAIDCYFDSDSGGGNDACMWDAACDPLSPLYTGASSTKSCVYYGTPEPTQCTQYRESQTLQCWDSSSPAPSGNNVCGSVVPNGCDCFGCCLIPGQSQAIYLGSEDASGKGTCTPATLGDPSKCRPCTQVPSCLNTCGRCELCFGKTEIPPDCLPSEQCAEGVQPCGLPGQSPCNAGYYCVTGCCQLNPT